MVTLSYYDGWYHQAPELHKSIGILLMMRLVVRVVWRLFSPPPATLVSYFRLTRITAAMDHLILYLLLFSIVISGYLVSTADGRMISVSGWFDIPTILVNADTQADLAGSLHLWLTWTMAILSLLYELMALKHHFTGNDSTFSRILGRSSPGYGA